MKTKHVVSFASALVLVGATAATAQQKSQVAPLKAPKVTATTTGGTIIRLTGAKAGLPASTMPGVRLLSTKEFFAKYPTPDKAPSGLFLLDTGYVPHRLASLLKADSLTLKADGTLVDAKGTPVTVVMNHNVGVVTVGKKTGLLERLGVVASAHASNPYPLETVDWWWLFRSNSGFCRTLRVETGGGSWGPADARGARAHTRIEYIETRARFGSRGDHDSCRNCDTLRSIDTEFIGCFWPASGLGHGEHFVNFKEGGWAHTWSHSW
jgi:hypothetical protein